MSPFENAMFNFASVHVNVVSMGSREGLIERPIAIRNLETKQRADSSVNSTYT